MINRDELKTATGVVAAGAGAEVAIGSAVAQNLRRFIYRIKFINQVAGPNALLVGKRENGAGVTTNIDTVQAAVLDEMVLDPEELKEDSAPLYVIDGPPGQVSAVLANYSLFRAYTNNGAGIVTIWFVDAPA